MVRSVFSVSSGAQEDRDVESATEGPFVGYEQLRSRSALQLGKPAGPQPTFKLFFVYEPLFASVASGSLDLETSDQSWLSDAA